MSPLCVSALNDNPVFSTPEGLPGPLVSTSLGVVSTPRHLLTASLAFPQHLPASADMLGPLLEGGDPQDPEEGGPFLPLEEDASSLGKGS